MAVLNSSVQNVVPVYSDGSADKVFLFAMRNVTTGDTVDLTGHLLIINRAVCIGITAFAEIACSWTGTVVTIPSGLSNDAGYLLTWGSGL